MPLYCHGKMLPINRLRDPGSEDVLAGVCALISALRSLNIKN